MGDRLELQKLKGKRVFLTNNLLYYCDVVSYDSTMNLLHIKDKSYQDVFINLSNVVKIE